MKKTVVTTALFSQVIRLISGPVVLLIISSKFSTSEISLYYTFFSVVAIQQVLEMGVGFTIKQFISHAYKKNDNTWTLNSKMEIKSYLVFSQKWYFLISLFIFFVIGLVGYVFFSSKDLNFDWETPWFLMILVVGFFVNFIPFQLIAEGCQQQVILFRANIVYSIVNSFVLSVFILFGFGLYSISAALLFSNIFLYLILLAKLRKVFFSLYEVDSLNNFKSVFKKIWPMLSKISVTWILGYFFWNSFNIIGFKLLPIDLSGQLAFTVTLALTGYNIVSVIINSQTTIFSNLISKGKVEQALSVFKRSHYISMCLCFMGYSLFLLLHLLLPELNIFNKTLPIKDLIFIFLYFYMLLSVTNKANFSRCFKKEPFFYLSMACNILIPVFFYLICKIKKYPDFSYLLILSVVFHLWATYIFNNVCKFFNNNSIK